MKKKILYLSEIETIDIDLVGKCNLKCPLCISQRIKSNRENLIDIDKLIILLEQFKKLKTVYIAGDYSEPTLHPKLFQLLDYFKFKRCDTQINLFTNASTHNQEYWINLNKHFLKNSSVIFTICGST